MAGALKHAKRSHRSYNTRVDYSDFHRKSNMKAYAKENKGILSTLFKRKVGE